MTPTERVNQLSYAFAQRRRAARLAHRRRKDKQYRKTMASQCTQEWMAVAKAEEPQLRQLILDYDGCVAEVARRLGYCPSATRRRIRALGLERLVEEARHGAS